MIQSIPENLPVGIILGLALLSSVRLLHLLVQLYFFIHLHFVHSSTLSRYRRPGAWALVTGATGGIGEVFADQLAQQGFNIVLHGRNEGKLQTSISIFERKYPKASFRYVVADAANSHGMKQAILRTTDEMASLPGPLTVLVNNVGALNGIYGHKSPFLALQNITAADVDSTINLNARFTTQLTRGLLPIMSGKPPNSNRPQAKAAPFLILNISSLGGVLGSPLLSVYSGTKAYISSWSCALSQELAMQPHLSTGECMCFSSGIVAETGGVSQKSNFWQPTARIWVRAALDKVGCGRLLVRPYIGHDIIGMLSFDLLPEWAIVMAQRIAIARERRQWMEREIELSKGE
ncbi:MAG: hypothetical protein Q9159_001716 [Coniocarpon cinnabarinum]